MNVIKDVEAVATAGLGLKVKLAIGAGLVAVVAAGALFLANHYEEEGRQLERAVWLKKQVDWDTQVAKLKSDNEAKIVKTIAENQAKERKTSELHEQEVATIRGQLDRARSDATRNGGLRIPAPACASTGPTAGSTEAPGTSGRDEASAGTVALPQQLQDSLWSIVGQADEVSAQLRACQGWIKLNGFYGEAQ